MLYSFSGGESWTANDTSNVVTGFMACGTGLVLIVDFGDPPVECILSTPTSYDCNPLMLIFSACPALASFGFGTFTVADTAVAR